MILSTIDIIVLVVLLLSTVLIGLYFGRSKKKTLSEYFLGGRSLPWYIAGISMVATTFAADTPLAVTELVGQYGISGNWLVVELTGRRDVDYGLLCPYVASLWTYY
jgi:SSS family solute:Na+ symporter